MKGKISWDLTEWSSVLIKCKQSEKLDNCSYFFWLKFGKSKITFRKNNAYCVLDFKYLTPDWHVTKYSRCRWQGLGQHCLQTFSDNKLRVCKRNKKLSCYSEWKFNTKTTKLVGWFAFTSSSWSSVSWALSWQWLGLARKHLFQGCLRRFYDGTHQTPKLHYTTQRKLESCHNRCTIRIALSSEHS